MYNYFESSELDAKFLELKYKDSDVSMLIALPNKNDGLSALEAKIAPFSIQDLAKNLNSQPVIVEIPKFKIEFNVNMIEPLKKVSCYHKKKIT